MSTQVFPKPNLVFGTALIADFPNDVIQSIFKTLEKHSVKELDTARVYVGSEATLGKVGAAKRFAIQTKAPGLSEGCLKKQSVLDGMNQSLKELRVDSVDIYYLHMPDESTPIEETLTAIQQLYTEGKFKRLGISNFTPSQVQQIYSIQKAASSVLPTVFQGNYNPVARLAETSLLPLLRKLKIAFYAYSPIAGGFLVKDSSTLRSNTDTGRFGPSHPLSAIYAALYGKETIYDALDEWGVIAKDAGISKAALAYRWVTYHSILKEEYGDGVVFGASSEKQLEETLKAIDDGPLGKETMERVEGIWKMVEKEAPMDNYQDFVVKIGVTKELQEYMS